MDTVGNLTIGIKLALDNREMSGNLAISRDQLRAFAADMKRAADAGSGAFGATRTALKSISTQLADQVQQVNARLQLAVSGAREFAGAQRFAYRVAAQTGAGFEAWAASTILASRRQLSWPVEAGNDFDDQRLFRAAGACPCCAARLL
jgi:hypothetical protein